MKPARIVYNEDWSAIEVELNDRCADYTDLYSIEDVAIRVWRLEDGSVFEECQDRRSTSVIKEKIHAPNSEAAWYWCVMIDAAKKS